jgi:hypothetical protein
VDKFKYNTLREEGHGRKGEQEGGGIRQYMTFRFKIPTARYDSFI